MSIRLQVNGVEYTDFTAATVEIRLDTLSNVFSFSAVSAEDKPLPFTGGEPCRVMVNDQPVLTGFIEVVEGSYNANSHTISVQGRDKTGDLLDSSLDVISDLSSTITFKKIIERIIDDIGADVKVIDNANPDPFKLGTDIQSPEVGDNAFNFIEALARKRQVLLSSNGDGDIVITRASSSDSGAKLQNIANSDDNNILNASYSYDTTGRFNFYKAASSLNLLAVAPGNVAPSNLVDQSASAQDSNVRQGRKFVFVPENNLPIADCSKRATWEANIRKARGKVYSCVVYGYEFAEGQLWDINHLVTVVDEFAEINAKMLINSVTFGFDVDNGSTTTLSIIEKNAYTLTLQEPKAQQVGPNFA